MGGSRMEIRPYRNGDRDQVGLICLKTGDAGQDATAKHADDQLLPHIYALPYVDYAPQWAWVAEEDGVALGYILAIPDRAAFHEWWQNNWVPVLEERFPTHERRNWPQADQQLLGSALDPETDSEWQEEYPAELHIDILPEGQGRGLGRKLMETLVGELREQGIAGLAFGVDGENANAIGFYKRLGFEVITETMDGDRLVTVTMGVRF